MYLYRVIDQYGPVIDVLISPKRDLAATHRLFIRASRQHDPASRIYPSIDCYR